MYESDQEEEFQKSEEPIAPGEIQSIPEQRDREISAIGDDNPAMEIGIPALDESGGIPLEGFEPYQEGDGRAWYVVHCYSVYENKVRHNLEQLIETM